MFLTITSVYEVTDLAGGGSNVRNTAILSNVINSSMPNGPFYQTLWTGLFPISELFWLIFIIIITIFLQQFLYNNCKQ